MTDRLNSNTPETNNIKKYLAELASRLGEEKAMKFTEMFAKALDELDEANMYSDFRYKKFPEDKNNVKFTLEVMVDINDYAEDDPELAVRCRHKEKGDVIFLWSYEKFLERLDLMRDWYDDAGDDGIINRERFVDPWMDVTEADVQEKEEDRERENEDQIKKLKIKIAHLEK